MKESVLSAVRLAYDVSKWWQPLLLFHLLCYHIILLKLLRVQMLLKISSAPFFCSGNYGCC